jgi:hypothetical protein
MIDDVKFKTYNLENSTSSIVKYRRKEVKGLKTFTAKSITIDNYCRENKIVPDGIKIDVEGAEGLVIERARNIIKSYSPWALIEFHFMDIEEKERNWEKITEFAKNIIFIEGDDSKYQYKDNIKTIPDGRFHVFIKY